MPNSICIQVHFLLALDSNKSVFQVSMNFLFRMQILVRCYSCIFPVYFDYAYSLINKASWLPIKKKFHFRQTHIVRNLRSNDLFFQFMCRAYHLTLMWHLISKYVLIALVYGIIISLKSICRRSWRSALQLFPRSRKDQDPWINGALSFVFLLHYSFNYVVVEFFLSCLLLFSNASEPVSIV